MVMFAGDVEKFRFDSPCLVEGREREGERGRDELRDIVRVRN